MPTEIWLSQLRSGSAHRTRSWGPAVSTDIWRSRLKSSSAHWDLELTVDAEAESEAEEVEAEAGRGGQHLWQNLESIDPHLAGGNQENNKMMY